MKPGKYIGEFVSGGRKNYAYRIYDQVTRQPEDTVCNVREITLYYSTSKQVNFDVIKDMILGEETGREDGGCGPERLHTEMKIMRNKQKDAEEEGGAYVSLVTEPEGKMYKITFFKRRRLKDNTSLPFGYI